MAKTSPSRAAGRALAWLAALVVGLTAILGIGVATGQAGWAPKLALDLEGGTQMVLAPQTASGEQATPEQLAQAVEIIRQRVDGSGVAEAEVATQGDQNVVVSLPGVPDEDTRRLIQASADLQFRPVLQSAPGEPTPEEQLLPKDQFPAPSAEPVDAYDPNWLTPDLADEFQRADCTVPRDPNAPRMPEDRAVVACQPAEETPAGTAPAIKYVLGPVVVSGTEVDGAQPGLAQTSSGVSTNEWGVNVDFTDAGARAFQEVTQRLTPMPAGDPRKQFAMVLDGRVISAPSSDAVITGGSARIDGGSFTEQSANQLAEQLNYGSLPISFTIESEQQISATLGQDQLRWGLIAGLIGLVLVAVYQFFQYRALGLLTFASILVMGLLTYLAIVILGWTDNYRLSLAGIAGLIVAIGLTADSFIVYFERIKDELRAGRPVEAAVHEGWKRAKRTVTASKAVNLLAALVLFFVAVGNVRGFAFTLGLTAVADLLVVFLFTHPLMVLLAQGDFVGRGHRMSGLDPRQLGVDSALYRGAGQVREPRPAPAGDDARSAGSAPEEAPVGPEGVLGGSTAAGARPGRRRGRGEPAMTIAERRRAERARAAEAARRPADTQEDAS